MRPRRGHRSRRCSCSCASRTGHNHLSIGVELGCQGGNQLPRFSLAQRGLRQRSQDAPVGGGFLRTLQEQARRRALQVGHRSELGEFHESERPCHGGVHTKRRRYHPQQVVQLVEHHRRATHRGAQHELVNVEGEPGPTTVPAEQALLGQPSGHTLVDLFGGYVSRTADQRARRTHWSVAGSQPGVFCSWHSASSRSRSGPLTRHAPRNAATSSAFAGQQPRYPAL
jgi:hypothetical protein